MQQSITCEVVTLGQLIRRAEKFIIPPFQRNYAWSERQYGAFWNDLAQTFTERGDDYFLGAVVLKPVVEDGGRQHFIVIDGQQRLTTTAIMLAALRHHLRTRNADVCAEQLETAFLKGGGAAGAGGPRLHLNAANRSTYEDYIYRFEDIKRINDGKKGRVYSNTNALMLNCFGYMHKQIAKVRHEHSLTIEALFDQIIQSLEARITLINISVKDDAKAYVLFETLNERGLELSQFDLLKNYLLTAAEPHVAKALDCWNRVETNLQNQSIGDFMRQYMSSQGKTIGERQLFKALRKSVTGSRQAVDYLQRLADASHFYAALNEPDHNLWQSFSAPQQAKLRDAVKALRSIGAQQAFVPLIAAVEVWAEDRRASGHLAGVFAMFAAFTIRYTAICGLPPNRLTKPYVRAAAFIRHEKSLEPELLFSKFLAGLYPDDEAFTAAFRTKTSDEYALCRYLLAKINDHLPDSHQGATGRGVSGQGSLTSTQTTSIDHILPQNPSAEWLKARRHFRGGFKAYINRLGNMTLLTPEQNQKIGNGGFQRKREVFASDTLAITRQVAEAEQWTPREIEKRQRWMAQIAAAIWRCT